jgi:hypothetical protein
MTDSAPTRQLKGARTGAACDRVVRSLLAAVALATVLLPSATEAAPGTTARYVRKTSGPVLALAADGDRAAVVVAGKNLYPGSPFIGCSSVVVWEPVRSRSGVLESAARCARTSLQETIGVAIAGTRVAWLVKGGVNSVGTLIKTATLMRRTPVELAGGGALDGLAGTFVRPRPSETALCSCSRTNCAVTRTTRTTPVLRVARPTTSLTRQSGGWPGGARALKVRLAVV